MPAMLILFLAMWIPRLFFNAIGPASGGVRAHEACCACAALAEPSVRWVFIGSCARSKQGNTSMAASPRIHSRNPPLPMDRKSGSVFMLVITNIDLLLLLQLLIGFPSLSLLSDGPCVYPRQTCI